MAEQGDFNARKHVHISFDIFRDGIAYSYPRRRIDPKPLREDYEAHSKALLDQLTMALGEIPTELPRVYRRVKLSEDEPYGREEEDIALFA